MMGDNFNPPKIERRNNTVDTQAETDQQNTQAQETRQVTSPVHIYQNGIDEFTKFLRGEIGGGSLEERQKIQKSFLESVWNFLKMDYSNMKEVMDYFLVTVKQNPNEFAWDKIISPLAVLEGTVNSTELTRYKRFMMFATLLSEYARNRNQFTTMFDMTKFEAMFNGQARTNLHTYVYR
jgi:hypothetical protein